MRAYHIRVILYMQRKYWFTYITSQITAEISKCQSRCLISDSLIFQQSNVFMKTPFNIHLIFISNISNLKLAFKNLWKIIIFEQKSIYTEEFEQLVWRKKNPGYNSEEKQWWMRTCGYYKMHGINSEINTWTFFIIIVCVERLRCA